MGKDPTEKPALTFAQKMRKLALKMKSNKDRYVEKVLDGIAFIRGPLKHEAARAKMVVLMANEGLVIVDEVLANEKLRTGITEAVGHAIQDSANRLNELAGVMESASNNKVIKESINRAKKAFEEFSKANDSFDSHKEVDIPEEYQNMSANELEEFLDENSESADDRVPHELGMALERRLEEFRKYSGPKTVETVQ